MLESEFSISRDGDGDEDPGATMCLLPDVDDDDDGGGVASCLPGEFMGGVLLLPPAGATLLKWRDFTNLDLNFTESLSLLLPFAVLVGEMMGSGGLEEDSIPAAAGGEEAAAGRIGIAKLEISCCSCCSMLEVSAS